MAAGPVTGMQTGLLGLEDVLDFMFYGFKFTFLGRYYVC